LLEEAQRMIASRRETAQQPQKSDSLFGLFRPPADTVMTEFKLAELERRVNQLLMLIGPENRGRDDSSADRLARFIRLDPHSLDYPQHLDGLLEQMEDDDPLRDNVLLAQIKLVTDHQVRAERLAELHAEFPETDGGMLALYELGLLKISLWRQMSDASEEQRKAFLAETRQSLSKFLRLYPNSFCAEQVRKNLAALPALE